MDANKQAQDLMRTWMEVQQRTWENWFKTMQQMGANTAAGMFERERERSTEAWEQAVQQAMDAQAEWMRTWMQSMIPQGGAAPNLNLGQQGQDMLQNWTNTQTQLWEGWFATARQVLDLSEHMLKQTLEMQAQMMQQLANQAEEATDTKQRSKK